MTLSIDRCPTCGAELGGHATRCRRCETEIQEACDHEFPVDDQGVVGECELCEAVPTAEQVERARSHAEHLAEREAEARAEGRYHHPAEESPSYRSAMIDAGRGHLLG